MLYSLIRILLVIVVIIVIILFCHKKKIKLNKFKRVIIILLIVAFDILIYAVPFENCFVTFSSLDTVFKYSDVGIPITSFEGDESAVVVYLTKDESMSFSLFRKSNDGWKVGTNKGFFDADLKMIDRQPLTICQDRKSDEFFVIFNNFKDNTNVSDNRNSTFYTVEKDGEKFCYAIVKGEQTGYVLTLNGSSIELK